MIACVIVDHVHWDQGSVGHTELQNYTIIISSELNSSLPVLSLCVPGKRICCTSVVSVLSPSTDRLLSSNM